MNAFDAAEKAGRSEQLRAELAALFDSQNRAGSGTEIPATYLKVLVTKA
jgi:hypothetical protein